MVFVLVDFERLRCNCNWHYCSAYFDFVSTIVVDKLVLELDKRVPESDSL